jgi:hypothetical protein
MKIGKLKKYQQRGGVKVSIKKTENVFVPTDDPDIIIPHLFSNCDNVRLLSSGSSGFAFIMHLKPDSTIKLRSQTVDEAGNPLTQLDAADRWRFVNKGLLMENCCVKISLVETTTTPFNLSLFYTNDQNDKKSGVSRKEAMDEVETQKKMHRASMSGTGVHGVFIPGVITDKFMIATEFETLARTFTNDTDTKTALAWIISAAKHYHYNIQVFCMELIQPDAPYAFTTFREFMNKAANSATHFPLDTVAVACKTAAAVISTFTKSSFWSYDTHGENIMTNGISVFLLDFGRIYNIIDSKSKIDNLLKKMLSDSSIKAYLPQFFGLAPGISDDNIKATFNAIYNRYMDLERSVIIRRFIIDSTVADDIRRVRSNIFEILILFALIDGMTNRYKYKNPGFQCIEYMYFIFRTANTFRSLDLFLQQCSSTLDGFETVRTALALVTPNEIKKVNLNLNNIAHLLQGALVPSAEMGLARRSEDFGLPKSGVALTPEEKEYREAQNKIMQDEELARQRDAAKQEDPPGEIFLEAQNKIMQDEELARLIDAAKQEHPPGEIQLGPARSVRNTDRASLLRANKPYGGTIKFQVRRKRQRTRRRSYHSTRRRLRRGGNTTVKYK